MCMTNRSVQVKLHRTEELAAVVDALLVCNFKQRGPQRVLHNGKRKKHHSLIIVEISPERHPPDTQAQVVNI